MPPNFSNLLQSAWLRRGPLACALWPFSKVFGVLSAARSGLYALGCLSAERVHVPVIVVGNVVVGGGGKTPLVIALAQHLRRQGVQVGVVSRGFGRVGAGVLEVTAGMPVSKSGDEPALIKHAALAPVFVAKKRIDAARALLAACPHTQIVLCDDALAHLQLHADARIAVFDDRGLGNGWLLPAGPLRESWPRRTGQPIDLVLHTGNQAAFAGFRSSRRVAEFGLARDGSQVALSSLAGKTICAVAGIATPDAFFALLRAQGVVLARTQAWPDHSSFDGFLQRHQPGDTVLCTEKDAVKLQQMPELAAIEVLAVPLIFSPEPGFWQAFDLLTQRLLAARTKPELPSKHGH